MGLAQRGLTNTEIASQLKLSSRTVAIATLKQYREITRRESSNIRLELFEQADRQAHFCIVETWLRYEEEPALSSASVRVAP